MLLYYLIAVNVLAFVMMGLDKHKAKKRARRIPEKALFLTAILGGSVGAILGMYTFRHKTKHRSFTFGLPAILLLQAALAVWLLR